MNFDNIASQMAHAMHTGACLAVLGLIVVLALLTVSELRNARRAARIDRAHREGLGDLRILRRR